MKLSHALARIASDLQTIAAGHCLVGGLAIAVRTEPRFTRDLDFAVAVADDGEAESLIRALHDRRYVTYSTIEQARTGRLATARLWSPDGDDRVAVDLLFASSGIEPELCAHAEPVEVLPSLVIPVARAGHLVALKLLSVGDDRPHDAQDLVGLRRIMTPEDLALARDAIALIEQRQAARGRDLKHALAQWIGQRG